MPRKATKKVISFEAVTEATCETLRRGLQVAVARRGACMTEPLAIEQVQVREAGDKPKPLGKRHS